MRFITVHSKSPVIDPRGHPVEAHAFGPFDSDREAIRFEEQEPDDCFRFLMEIVEPPHLRGRDADLRRVAASARAMERLEIRGIIYDVREAYRGPLGFAVNAVIKRILRLIDDRTREGNT